MPGRRYCAAHLELYRQRDEQQRAAAKVAERAEEDRWLAIMERGKAPPEHVPLAVAARLWRRQAAETAETKAAAKPARKAARKAAAAAPPPARRSTMPPPQVDR
jgi:hypothetical protein